LSAGQSGYLQSFGDAAADLRYVYQRLEGLPWRRCTHV
jgi:hypothetical protein